MTNNKSESANPTGSVWHRWDPHIHMPGTLNNDNFKGDDTFKQYIKVLNETVPSIRAIGITDYYVLDSYEKLLAAKVAGDLPHLELLFPNIELRFAVNAQKGSPINVHLLICPDDPEHIPLTKRFLQDLKFDFNGEQYGCTNEDLVRLGRAFNSNTENDTHALKQGVEQFKVSHNNLTEAFKKSKWARENIMVAIAASKNDGTGQLQDGGLKALREELQRLSHIIFSGRPADKIYWCGNGPDSVATIKDRYGNLKPCLHGCDAHDFDTVGKPDQDRYCWVRGDLVFETLRQVCMEPNNRVYIGKELPTNGRLSDTIADISVTNADWMKISNIPINTGLVAIIGARGSGKTALVEMIAAGANSINSSHMRRSFLERAKEYLGNTTSQLRWASNEHTQSMLYMDNIDSENDDPRVRYLSQQFVDQLCSSDGLADELVSEIERVVFEAHLPDDRLGTRSFSELRDIKTQSVKLRIENLQEVLNEIGNEISIQDDLRRSLNDLIIKRASEYAANERMKGDRNKLTPTNNSSLLARLEAVRNNSELKFRVITELEKKELNLVSLKEEVEYFGDVEASQHLDQLKARYPDAGLDEEQWNKFSPSYEADVKVLLDSQINIVKLDIAKHKGPAIGEPVEETDKSKALEYFSNNINMKDLTYSLLLKEQRRLEAIIGIDVSRRRQYTELSSKIARGESLLAQRDAEIKKGEAAPVKIAELIKRREVTYSDLIAQIDVETKLLETLYQPLQDRLDSEKGTLQKLRFSVIRKVDIDAWAEAGERLIDKSKAGRFRGIGTLTQIIKDALEDVWKTGTAKEISEAMSTFRAEYSPEFWNHAFEDAKKNREVRKNWSHQVSAWLYSINHVVVSYGLEYEDVDIKLLSPGTRGIVLLLLYLSIDTNDERPLIIDQPEENLDPKSIYQELVERFKEAKTRRQIIIVTHNANLVVNTDADQVIIASRGEHRKNALPDIFYKSGSLENSEIRAAVCEILEGGKEAFSERARRLRITL